MLFPVERGIGVCLASTFRSFLSVQMAREKISMFWLGINICSPLSGKQLTLFKCWMTVHMWCCRFWITMYTHVVFDFTYVLFQILIHYPHMIYFRFWMTLGMCCFRTAHKGLLQKRLERISTESSLMSPRRPCWSKGLS